jgi:hypothetical protein
VNCEAEMFLFRAEKLLFLVGIMTDSVNSGSGFKTLSTAIKKNCWKQKHKNSKKENPTEIVVFCIVQMINNIL